MPFWALLPPMHDSLLGRSIAHNCLEADVDVIIVGVLPL